MICAATVIIFVPSLFSWCFPQAFYSLLANRNFTSDMLYCFKVASFSFILTSLRTSLPSISQKVVVVLKYKYGIYNFTVLDRLTFCFLYDITYDNKVYLPVLSDTARFCFHSIIFGLENIPVIADWAEAIDIARSNIKDFSCASILSSTKTNNHFWKNARIPKWISKVKVIFEWYCWIFM